MRVTMNVMGLWILLLLAQSTPLLAATREYRYVPLEVNWAEAHDYCRENFAGLAAIETEEDWLKLRAMVIESGWSLVWTGFYDNLTEWRWSMDNTYLYQGGSTFGSWFALNFDNALSVEHCVSMTGGQLYDNSCGALMKSVCYDEPTNSFIPVMEQRSWSAAQSHCREAHTDLASVRSQQELNDIISAIGEDESPWWIGLYRDGWKWTDGSNNSFRAWDSGEPTGNTQSCGCTNVVGWHDCICNEIRPFICSVSRKRVLKVTLKKDESVNLNDQLIQAAILKQMEKQMEDQGLSQVVRLRWREQPDGNVFNKSKTEP